MVCINADYLSFVRLIVLDECGQSTGGAAKQMIVTDQLRRVAFDDAIERGADRNTRGVTGQNCRAVPGCVTESPKPWTVDWCGFNWDFAAMVGLATKLSPSTGSGYARTNADCSASIAAELVFKPPVDEGCSGGTAQCLRMFFPKIGAWGPANGFELTGADDVDNFASFQGTAIANPNVFSDIGHVSSDLAIWGQYWEDAPEAIFWIHKGDCPVVPASSCDLVSLGASPS